MGQVFISFAVQNSSDIEKAEDHLISAAQVRNVELPNVLMDTGATLLCLPASVVARLGLRLDREVPVATATGTSTLRVFRHARVQFEDRAAVVEAIELPDGSAPLLGAIPMEGLGIEPDLQNRAVRKLPMDLRSSFVRA